MCLCFILGVGGGGGGRGGGGGAGGGGGFYSSGAGNGDSGGKGFLQGGSGGRVSSSSQLAGSGGFGGGGGGVVGPRHIHGVGKVVVVVGLTPVEAVESIPVVVGEDLIMSGEINKITCITGHLLVMVC